MAFGLTSLPGIALAALGVGLAIASTATARAIVRDAGVVADPPGLRTTLHTARAFGRAAAAYIEKTGDRRRVALTYGLGIVGLLLFVGGALAAIISPA